MNHLGGASAGYHMLNERSRKLFTYVYSLGGSVLNHYIRAESNDLRDLLADRFGINTTTEEKMIEELKTIPTSVWLEYSYINQTTGKHPTNEYRVRQPAWAPVIESIMTFLFFEFLYF